MAYLATVPQSPLAAMATRLYGGGFLIYGIIIIAQGSQRWAGPTYRSVNAIGRPWEWGMAMVFAGLLILIGHFRKVFLLRNVGFYLAMLWMIVFTVVILKEALFSDVIPFSGSALYLLVAGQLAIIARGREIRT